MPITTLPQFIRAHMEDILVEWEAFAKSVRPDAGLTKVVLRDDAARILHFVATDMETSQTVVQQQDKSEGAGPELPNGDVSAAYDHGEQRVAAGFDLNQMVAEYRALRATVLRLWDEKLGEQLLHVKELIRFNEAIDQALAESTIQYTKVVSENREIFLAVLGHDLRSPLSAIQMAAGMLAIPKGRTSEDVNSAQIIQRSGKHMAAMISDLLDVARTRLGAQLPIDSVPSDMAEIVQDAVDEIRMAHPNREIIYTKSDDALGGDWDRARIRQLASNLLNNAIQYGFTETPIRVGVSRNADSVEVRVENAGPTIPDALIASIFDPLTRGPDSQRKGELSNMGLGLYIAREVVRAHGGRIWVHSENDKTAFVAALPVTATPHGPD